MANRLIKKCSAVEKEAITFSTCTTNYSFGGSKIFEYEDAAKEEPPLLAHIHQQFKEQFQQFDEIPENTVITIPPFVFKTGLKYKRGLAGPVTTCIDYTIEEIHGAD